MKFALVFLVALVVAVSAAPEYTSKFDNIDLDQILNNDRLLNNYISCLLKDTGCTPDGKELKTVLPDALATECVNCTEKQKKGSEKVIQFLSDKKPEIWKQLLDKYDKDGSYRAKYGEHAKKIGVEEHKYTTKYDNINVDEVLKSERLVTNYVGCFLDKNPCTPDAAELKRNLPDALETECASCSEVQKVGSDKFCEFLIKNRKEDWDKLEAKYDPSGSYRNKYLANKAQEEKSE
ncbi:ejaculatory bulb-specific protein 3-like [Belonocnema kinseyi]|uniref:ejaculatory bulb-specific protein 3-like n=1 Tax=Belonocnema kinseyi TaxID=2817044 RepID=UPI00143CD34A|nr:ejaculatory bulb-specific protein 3-like [Belonocnema kinseyi]